MPGRHPPQCPRMPGPLPGQRQLLHHHRIGLGTALRGDLGVQPDAPAPVQSASSASESPFARAANIPAVDSPPTTPAPSPPHVGSQCGERARRSTRSRGTARLPTRSSQGTPRSARTHARQGSRPTAASGTAGRGGGDALPTSAPPPRCCPLRGAAHPRPPPAAALAPPAPPPARPPPPRPPPRRCRGTRGGKARPTLR
jgi:hypothetical protein